MVLVDKKDNVKSTYADFLFAFLICNLLTEIRCFICGLLANKLGTFRKIILLLSSKFEYMFTFKIRKQMMLN